MTEVKSEFKFISEQIGAPSGLGDRFDRSNAGASGSQGHVDLFRENLNGGWGAGAKATEEFFAGAKDNEKSISAFLKNGESGLLAETDNFAAGYHSEKLGLGYGRDDFGASVVLDTLALSEDRVEIPSVSVRIKDIRLEFTEAGATFDGDLNKLLDNAADAIPFSISDQMRQSKFFSPLASFTDAVDTDIAFRQNRLITSASYTLNERTAKLGYEINVEDASKAHHLTVHGSLPRGNFMLDIPLQGDNPVLTLSPKAVPQLRIKLSEDEQKATYEKKY